MWYGVVHVLKVESIELRDFRHARGQRQIVRRIFEQGISRNIHLVIVNIGMKFSQADRLGIRNEMDLVSTLGQFNPELSGNDSATSVGWIAGDSNLHPDPFAPARWLSDSMATGAPG